jgi:hypothetical protein
VRIAPGIVAMARTLDAVTVQDRVQ